MADKDDAPETPDERSDEVEHEEPKEGSRFLRFTRRLLDRKELTDDAKILLGTVLDTSDRAKTEMVKMFAREVRNYLDELKPLDGLKELVTTHSLEVRASLSLKPLADAVSDEEPPPPKSGKPE